MLAIHEIWGWNAVMDFNCMRGNMRSIVGETVVRMVEHVIRKKLLVIILWASGGARIFEGIASLMQMVKKSLALGRSSNAKFLFISVLINPVMVGLMAGVMASFASLVNIIIPQTAELSRFS
jgi:acetyl-CoA carboxylase carboxyl transferase subunit beta